MQPAPLSVSPPLQPTQNGPGLSEGPNVWTWPPQPILPPDAASVPDVETQKPSVTNGFVGQSHAHSGGLPSSPLPGSVRVLSPVKVGAKPGVMAPQVGSSSRLGSPVRIGTQGVAATSICHAGHRFVRDGAAPKVGGPVAPRSPQVMVQTPYQNRVMPPVNSLTTGQGPSVPAASPTSAKSTTLAKYREDLGQLEEENAVLRTLMTTLSFFRDGRTTNSVHEVDDDASSMLSPEVRLQQRLQRKRQGLIELEGRKLRGEQLLGRADLILRRMRNAHGSLVLEIDSLRGDVLAAGGADPEPHGSEAVDHGNLQSCRKSRLRQMPSSSSTRTETSSASASRDALHANYLGYGLPDSSSPRERVEAMNPVAPAATGQVGGNIPDSPKSNQDRTVQQYPEEPHTPEPPWGKDAVDFTGKSTKGYV